MKQKQFVEGRGYSKADWDAVSEDEDSTPEQLAQAKPFAEAFPELAASIERDRAAARNKKLISLRLTPEVIERFKAGGPGWQTRMDEALKKAVGLTSVEEAS